MTNKILFVPMVFCLMALPSCSSEKQAVENKPVEVAKVAAVQELVTVKSEPHRYGGWHCPDNLFGFPAVNINQWKNVPVVNGRMPTKEETQNGTSLIHVDLEKYPNTKIIDITLPKLARIYNRYSKRDDLIIVIQAVKINDDSIVGFRYLNGGNGSARLHEIEFLTEKEIEAIPESKFVTQNILIDATQEKVWKVLTQAKYSKEFQSIFDHTNALVSDWRQQSNVNYKYANSGNLTSGYGDLLFGNYYIQNDFDKAMYTEKFFLVTDEATNNTELKIIGGPFGKDYKTQEKVLTEWASKVKVLSEKP